MALHRKIDALKTVAICFMMMHGTALLGQGGWTDDGTAVRLTTGTDKVGIGTANPEARLDIQGGDVLLDNAQYIRFEQSNGDNKAVIGFTSANITEIHMGASGATVFKGSGNNELMRITTNGDVGIGTTNPQSKLAVAGIITAQEVKVTSTGWPDYVFGDDYNLMPLAEVAAYIASNGHLPEVPTSDEVTANGLSLGASQALLLKKIEELTLYMIEMQKENDLLGQRVATLEEGQ